MSSFVIFLLTLLSIFPFRQCLVGRVFTFEMHHRFSETVKKWSLQKIAGPLQNWPVKGSLQYYTHLANHDRLLHGRRLFKFDGPLTFSDGNFTFRISSLGLCASTDDPTLDSSDFELSIYSLNGSSTSKKVTCSDSFCTERNNCVGVDNHCPYSVSYVSSENSTSGILVDDVLHLRTEGDEEYCGQVQTGSFLDVAAPNGLFGLGLEKISVPSVLSREGYMADSFSIPTYNISVHQIRVGTTPMDSGFTTLFDSGTSFTYLADISYTKLSESFHSQVRDKRHPPDPRIPFGYCYDMSLDANTSLIPSLSLTMNGGGQRVVNDPIIVISMQNQLMYCLAIVKSQDLNIIGRYDIEKVDDFPSQLVNTTHVPPVVAVGPGNDNAEKSDERTTNTPQSSSGSFVYQTFCLNLINCFLASLVLLVL
ncbi:unnamed protein product [Withania somnifera]